MVQRSERGEGVISSAIAVLIMAFLGVAMWAAFNLTMKSATSKVDNNVSQLGTNNGAGSTAGVGGTGAAP